MENRQEKKQMQKPEISEFHDRFRPYTQRIYRGALVLTGNPRSAEKIQTEVYLATFLDYLETGCLDNFEPSLIRVLIELFAEYLSRTTGQVEHYRQAQALDVIFCS